MDPAVRYGQVAINKGNFLPMVVHAREETFTKKNILSSWQATGLLPRHPQVVLAKLPAHGQLRSTTTSLEPATPRNSAELHRTSRQAQLLLRRGEKTNPADLADLIDRLE